MRQVSFFLLITSLNLFLYVDRSYADPSEIYAQALLLKGKKQYTESGALLEQIIERHPTFVRAYVQLVKVNEARQDPTSSERYFESLCGKNPRPALAYFGLALVREEKYQRGRAPAEESLAFYRQALERNPSVPLIYIRWADLMQKLKQLDQAEASAQSLLKKYPQNASAHFGLAYVYQLRAKWDKALRHLSRALAQDPSLLDAYYWMGFAYDLTGKSKEALQAFERGERLAEKINDREHQADFKRGLGLAYIRTGNFQRALRAYQQALQIYQTIGDPEGEGESLNKLGRVYRQLGDHNEAFKYLQRALVINRAVRNQKAEANSLNGLGTLRHYFGNYQGAIEDFQQALRLYQLVGDREGEAAIFNNIAHVYSGLEDHQKALTYSGQALKILRAVGNRGEEMIVLGNMGVRYQILGVYDKALAHYLESLSMARSIGDQNGQGVLYGYIGSVYSYLKDYQKAIEYYNQALAVHRHVGAKLEEGRTLNNLGVAHFDRGEHRLAINYLQKALGIGTSVNSMELIWSASGDLARVYRRQENYQQALACALQAIQVIEATRSHLQSAEHRASFLGGRLKIYEEAVDVLCKLDRRAEAFHYMEKAKARAFLDMLAESKMDLYQGVDAKLREEEREIHREISRIQAEIRREKEEQKKQALYTKLESEEARLEARLSDLKKRNPRYAQIHYPDVFDLKQVQRLLPRGSVLLEYMLGEEGGYLWAIGPDRFETYTLPQRAAVEKAAKKYLDGIQSKSRGGEEAGVELYQILIKPAEDFLSGQNSLVIVPDGILYYLPFEALAKPDHGSAGKAKAGFPAVLAPPTRRYLIEDYQVGYGPSATAFGLIKKERAPRKGQKAVLAFGDPVYPSEPTGAMNNQPGAIAGVASHRFTRLPYSRQEVDKIGTLFSEDRKLILTGHAATEQRTKSDDIKNYQIIHFATHALLDEKSPSRSAILLASDGHSEDGFLQMREVFNLKLNADLVVLSACQTGLGQLVRGEGMVGLTRAFFYAGASSVLATLWNVNDPSTAYFMQNFYFHLKQGSGKAEALRSAKLDMIRSKRLAHPFYWAGFILQGDLHQPVFSPFSPFARILIYSLVMVALLVLIDQIVSRRRKSVSGRRGSAGC